MLVFETVGADPGPEAALVLTQARSMYSHLPASSRLGISVSGANHFTFSDQMLVKNPIPLAILRSVGVIGLDGKKGLRITEDYVSAYFDEYLNGKPRTQLNALARKYREVRVW